MCTRRRFHHQRLDPGTTTVEPSLPRFSTLGQRPSLTTSDETTTCSATTGSNAFKFERHACYEGP
jgi:hypothetical protein